MTKAPGLKSLMVKRSVTIGGRKTSVSLEDAFWSALKEIAIGRDQPLSSLIAQINDGRQRGNLSSAIRLFVLDTYRDRVLARHHTARAAQTLLPDQENRAASS